MTTDSDRDDRDPPGHVVATRVVAARRRPLAVPAIIAIAVAVMAIGFLGQKVVPPRPPVEPTPTPAPVSVDWTELTLDPRIFQSALVGLVVSTPGGLLAFGQDTSDRQPITWTSPDGRAWVRHDQSPGTFGGGVPDAAALVGSTYAAVGYQATVNGTTREIWTSADGVSWARDPSPSGRGFDEVRSLVGSGGTAVLVGSGDGRYALFSSEDGLLWTPATDQEGAFGRDAFISNAIASGDGYLAVGSVGSDGAIWRSPDGRAWSRVTPADPAVFATSRFERLMRTTTGFVLAGYSESGISGWVSSDGVTWAPDTTSSIGLRDLGLVLALDGGNLGIPSEAIGGGFGALTVWADPEDPSTTASPTDAAIDWTRQAAVVDGRVVLLAQHPETGTIGAWVGSMVGSGVAPTAATPGPSGAQGSAPPSPPPSSVPSRRLDPAVAALRWTRLTSHDVLVDDIHDMSMTGVVNLDSKVVAYGSIGNDGVIWTASDAGHWKRLPASPAMRGASLRAVTAGAVGRLIAVGAVLGPDGQETPAAWTSPDGVAWKRVAVPLAGSIGAMSDVASGPEGLVAVGWQDAEQVSRPAIWTSLDGSAWSAVPLSAGEFASGYIQAIAHDNGGYVAVGASQPPDGSGSAGAAWTSVDGRTWSSVGDQAAFAPPPETATRGGGISLADITAGGPGFVAIANLDGRSGPVGAIFTSRDGRDWARQAPDSVVSATFLRSVTTWAGGLAIAGNAGYTGSDPTLLTSVDGGAWSPLARADLIATARDEFQPVTLGGIAGFGPDLIVVGGAGGYPARAEGAIWVGAPAGTSVPDHVCPARVDSLAVLASMTAADRAACIGRLGVTISALVRASDGGCSSSDLPDELTLCGGQLALAPTDGGPAVLTTPIDRALIAAFPSDRFSPWTLTFGAGVVSPACVATPTFNGVIYVPPDSVRLQCLGVLRLVASSRIPSR